MMRTKRLFLIRCILVGGAVMFLGSCAPLMTRVTERETPPPWEWSDPYEAIEKYRALEPFEVTYDDVIAGGFNPFLPDDTKKSNTDIRYGAAAFKALLALGGMELQVEEINEAKIMAHFAFIREGGFFYMKLGPAGTYWSEEGRFFLSHKDFKEEKMGIEFEFVFMNGKLVAKAMNYETESSSGRESALGSGIEEVIRSVRGATPVGPPFGD